MEATVSERFSNSVELVRKYGNVENFCDYSGGTPEDVLSDSDWKKLMDYMSASCFVV